MLVSAFVGLVVLGTLAVVLGGPPSPGGDDTKAATSASASDSDTGDQQPTSGGGASDKTQSIRACSAELSRASSVVEAAARGVSDWSGHVQARTDMLQGRISVSAMDAIWKRTRLAGPSEQRRFQSARKGYQSTSRCGDLLATSASSSDREAGCVARAKAATRAVAAGEMAMLDWETHLSNMSMYADGRMNSVTAQRRWVSAWRHAPSHIASYRSARVALEKAPPCKSAG